MVNVSSSTSLKERLTLYDAFNMLKNNIPQDNVRHTLEGSVIIASPSIMHSKSDMPRVGDAHDARYKLALANTMIDCLNQYSHQISDPEIEFDSDKEIARLLSLPVVWNYPGYGHKGINLPFIVTQIYSKIDEKKLMTLCRRVGESTDRGLNRFYKSRGYHLSESNRPTDIASYLIGECEYVTRVAAEMTSRSRK